MRDKPAMTILHLGLGLSNGLANLHNAKRARTPVLNVVGEHATWHQHWDSVEATDIKGLAAPVSGWVRSCTSAQTVRQDTADAISAALLGQVAVLIVPQDCQWDECLGQSVIDPKFSSDPMDQARIKEGAERLLRHGPTTLLFLGGHALRRRGLLAAARIKAATGCGVLAETFTARMERGAGLPSVDRLPYFPEAAVAGLSHYQTVVLAGAKEPIAAFGYKGGQSRFLSNEQRICDITDGTRDVEEVLDYLADLVSRSRTKASSASLQGKGDRPGVTQGPLTAEMASRTLAAIQPEGAIIVEEAVTSARAYYEFSNASPPHTVLALTGGAIGQGMPCSVGAAIACPYRPVINFQGDGSALYTVQALWTQAHEGLNVTTLICSNRSYDILKIEMARAGYVPLGASARALTDLGTPPLDWAQLSRSMGVPGVSVETAEDLANELGKALEEPGPHLIEMKLTR